MTDPVSKKGFGDAALAKRVVDAYGADDLFPLFANNQCEELGIEKNLCQKLWLVTCGSSENGWKVLEVTNEERSDLLNVGFSTEFVDALVHLDKTAVLQRRAQWLRGRLDSRHTTLSPSAYQWCVDNLGEIGPEARAALPTIFEFTKKLAGENQLKSFQAITRIEPDEYSLAYYFSGICLEKEGNLGDLVAGLMDRDEKVRACSYNALTALRKTDLTIPPSGLPLIRQAYHRSSNEKEKELLVHLAGQTVGVTEELLLFLEEAVSEAKNKKMENLAARVFYVLNEIGQAAIPTVLRLCKEKRCLFEEMDRFFAGTPLPEKYIFPYIEAIAANREFLERRNIYGKLKIPDPIIGSDGFGGLDQLRSIFEEGDDAVRHVVLAIQSERDYFHLEPVIPLLLTAIQSPDSGLAVFAAAWIIEFSQEIGPHADWDLIVKLFQGLLHLLDHPDSLICFRATHAFSKMLEFWRPFHYWTMKEKDKKTLAALFFKLSLRLGDALPETRKSAAQALGSFGEDGKLAIPLLVAMRLNDPDESCRVAAREAIAKIEERVL